MGESTERKSRQTVRKSNTNPGTGNTAEHPSHSTGNSTENGGAEKSGIGGIQVGSEEGISKLASIIPTQGTNKKAKSRPAAATPKAPSTTKAAGKQHDFAQTQSMVQTLLSVTFGIGSTRLGEHWALAPQESQALAEPITAILDRYDLTKLTGKYGDWIALFTALGIVITPRVMLQIELAKQKGGNRNGFKPKLVSTVQPKPGANSNPNTEASPVPSSSGPIQSTDAPHGSGSIKQSLAIYG